MWHVWKALALKAGYFEIVEDNIILRQQTMLEKRPNIRQNCREMQEIIRPSQGVRHVQLCPAMSNCVRQCLIVSGNV